MQIDFDRRIVTGYLAVDAGITFVDDRPVGLYFEGHLYFCT